VWDAAAIDLKVRINCHTFRATGITASMDAGGTLENAHRMATHKSPRTTKLYDRTGDEITLDEVERRKRHKKVVSTSRLRILPGASLDMAWVVGSAHQPHLVEESDKPGERTTGMHSNLFVTLPLILGILGP